MEKHLYKHLMSPGHSSFPHDVFIKRIDKTDPSYHIRREEYWINALKTKAAIGPNFDFDNNY